MSVCVTAFFQPQGIGEPSVYHAVVVIFLEFFAWGLLTTPMLTVSFNTQMLVQTQSRTLAGRRLKRLLPFGDAVKTVCMFFFLSILRKDILPFPPPRSVLTALFSLRVSHQVE